MAAQPLTHHEILGLVEPFTRRGRHLDLAASNRLERRLAFRPVEHAGESPAAPAMCETLQLEQPDADTFCLTRTLQHGALQASLCCEGARAEELLGRIEAVAPRRQFRFAPGHAIALCYRIEAASSASAAAPLVLTRGSVQIDALTLTMDVLPTRGTPAEMHLVAGPGEAIELPDDLLAVLGWGWSRLDRDRDGWRTSVALRGCGPARSRAAERLLEQAAQHLARTLAEPPARFHERFAVARWGVALRRVLPVASGAGLIAAAFAFTRLTLAQESMLRLMALNAPPLLLLLFFCQRELPRFEIPPVPRPPPATAWRPARHPDIPANQR